MTPVVSVQKSEWGDGTKAFGVTRAKITSQRRLYDEQPKAAVSASARVTVPLECCKVMS
jgi:hypothetical protein